MRNRFPQSINQSYIAFQNTLLFALRGDNLKRNMLFSSLKEVFSANPIHFPSSHKLMETADMEVITYHVSMTNYFTLFNTKRFHKHCNALE